MYYCYNQCHYYHILLFARIKWSLTVSLLLTFIWSSSSLSSVLSLLWLPSLTPLSLSLLPSSVKVKMMITLIRNYPRCQNLWSRHQYYFVSVPSIIGFHLAHSSRCSRCLWCIYDIYSWYVFYPLMQRWICC